MEKKLNRRDFLRLSAVVASGAVVAACAPAAPATPAVEEKPVEEAPAQAEAPTATVEKAVAPAEPAEIQWIVRTSPTENPWQRDIVIPRFKELNPNVEVNLIVAPEGQQYPKLLAMNAAGDTPDLWSTAISGLMKPLDMEMIRPLSDYIDMSSIISMDEYPDSVTEFVTVAGKVWGLPHMVCGSFVFYNKDLFDEAGADYPAYDWDDQSWTWDEMVTQAEKVTKNYGQGADAQYGILYGQNYYCALPWIWGHEPFPLESLETGYPCSFDLTSEKPTAAYQAEADLIFEHKVSPGPAEQDQIAVGGNPFQTSKLAMDMTGGWRFWGMREFTEFKFGAAAYPWVETNGAPVYPDVMVIARTSKAPEAAWELVEYISMGEGMSAYMQATNAQPAPQSHYEEWVSLFEHIVPREELLAGIEGVAKYGRISYTHGLAVSGEVFTAINQGLSAIWVGDKQLPDALMQIQEAVDKIIEDEEYCGKTLEDAAQRIMDLMGEG
jgi:multiple sugar transport system substrate-binding protein